MTFRDRAARLPAAARSVTGRARSRRVMRRTSGPPARRGAHPPRQTPSGRGDTPSNVATSGVTWGNVAPRAGVKGCGRGAGRPPGGTRGAPRPAGQGRRRLQRRAGAARRGGDGEDRAAGRDARRRGGGWPADRPADGSGAGDTAGLRRAAPVPAPVRRSPGAAAGPTAGRATEHIRAGGRAAGGPVPGRAQRADTAGRSGVAGAAGVRGR